MDLFAPWHLIVILLILLVIFGPSKLGDVGGALGKAVRDFKKAVHEPDLTGKTPPAASATSETNTAEPKV